MSFAMLCINNGRKAKVADMELEEPLRKPEDIIAAVVEANKSGDQEEIHNLLNDRQINLRTPIEEENENSGKSTRSVIRKLLEDSVNGDKIVERQLDKDVTTTHVNENSADFAVKIDFEGIFCDQSVHQTKVVRDLLDLRAENRENDKTFTNLLTHPVLATFIFAKWQKAKWYFYTTSSIFIIFLLLYSSFIIYLFNQPEVVCTRLEKLVSSSKSLKQLKEQIIFLENEPPLTDEEKEKCQNQSDDIAPSFLNEWENGFSVCEIFFLVFLIFLAGMEVYQAMVLRLQYFKELENYIEWAVLISACLTMIVKPYLLMKDSSWHASLFRGIAALGILSAWLELILIIGRYPFRGGDFSIMFYTILKKIARHVTALFLMIVGFAFAFMVVNYGHDESSFESPFRSIVVTLTMALGEFNFEDMYKNFGQDKTSRSFGMILLILLILFGTITMVNLFIAVIISDLSKMQGDVYIQNLVNMAQNSILVEALLPPCILNRMRVGENMHVCLHTICIRGCIGEKLASNFNPTKERIKAIITKKKDIENNENNSASPTKQYRTVAAAAIVNVMSKQRGRDV